MLSEYDVNFDEKVERASAVLKDEYSGDVNLCDLENCREISRLVLLVAKTVDADKTKK